MISGSSSASFSKQCLLCELIKNKILDENIFELEFTWTGPIPRAGQFFMIRPERTSVFLSRPVSVAEWRASTPSVRFYIAKRGKGTEELTRLKPGERAELSGPLGNAWADMTVEALQGPIALVGGGAGMASFLAFPKEQMETGRYHFYAGFKTKPFGLEDIPLNAPLVLATEDGSRGSRGRILDFLKPAEYKGVYACGPEPMLKAVAGSCKTAEVPCFISLERPMACGVGACLGCTVKTIQGNRRCCADGPIFKADEVIFDE